jgi:hypothetical protein
LKADQEVPQAKELAHEADTVIKTHPKITYHFGISASGDPWPILIRKTLEI